MDSNTPRYSLDQHQQSSEIHDDVTPTYMAAVDVTHPKEVATSDSVLDIAAQYGNRVVLNMPKDRDGFVNIGNNISNAHNHLHFKCRQMIQHTVINNYGDPRTNARQDQFIGVANTPDSNAGRFRYVRTPALEEAADILQEKGLVVLCGPPGSGKTTLAHALLNIYRDKGCHSHTIAHVQELMGCIWEEGRSLVLMDGVLGEVRVDRWEHKALRSVLFSLMESIKEGTLFLVLTVYPHVFSELRALDIGLGSSLFDLTSLVQIPTYPLHDDHKKAIITSHLQELQLDTPEQDALLKDILQKDDSGAAFPWCCRQMVAKWQSLADPTLFFTALADAHVPLILRMLRDPEHGETMAAVLSLTMLGSGRFLHNPGRAQPQLDTLGFRDFSDCLLEEYADVLKEYILNKLGNAFDSRAMYDAVGVAFGRTIYQPILLKVCDVMFLVQHVRTTQPATEFSVTIGPSPDDRQLLMQTMYDHMVRGRLPELCQHPSLHCPQFLQEFEALCRANKNYVKRLVSAVDPVHKIPLLYWSVWGPSENLTELCLKLTDGAKISLIFDAALAHALVEKTSSEKNRVMTKLLNSLLCNADMGTEEDIRLPLPSKEQCYTPELTAVRDHLVMDVKRDSLCYLNDPSFPISSRLVSMEVIASHDGDKVRVVAPSKHWYLTLRLLADREVDETDDEGNTMLHVAADTGDVDAVKIAVKCGASLTATNNRGQTPPQLAADKRTRKKKTLPNFHTQDIKHACCFGDEEKLKVLLCTSASVQNTVDVMGNTPLHWACGAGQTDIAALLISLGAHVNIRNKAGHTPLHHAYRHDQTALLLIEHQTDVNAKDNYGRTPLHYACKHSQTQTCLLLIQRHADVNVQDNDGDTPLHFACISGHRQTVLLLIRRHADVSAKDNDGYTPLHFASICGKTEAAELLMQNGADVNAKDDNEYTPLHCAIGRRQKHTALLLIQHHADVNVKGNDGCTPLHFACELYDTETALHLLLHHADIDAEDNYGRTPLHCACAGGRTQTALLLLQHHAGVNTKDIYGRTPLHCACILGRTQTAMVLIQHHADVNAREHFGRTPLLYACIRGQAPTAILLMQHDADINANDNDGRAPLLCACMYGKAQIALLLLQRHADVTAKSLWGYTPLHYACELDDTETALRLIQRHADVNAKAKNGCTPLDKALYRGKIEMSRLLIEHSAKIERNSWAHKKLKSLGIAVTQKNLK